MNLDHAAGGTRVRLITVAGLSVVLLPWLILVNTGQLLYWAPATGTRPAATDAPCCWYADAAGATLHIQSANHALAGRYAAAGFTLTGDGRRPTMTRPPATERDAR